MQDILIMEHYNIHFSPTGGTKKVADIICGTLEGDFHEVDLCSNIEQMSLCEEDICLVSVPSYGGRVPGAAIGMLKNLTGHGAKAVLNCVYGNRAWEDTLTELQDTLEGQGFRCVAALATVAEHSIFRQFATGRPDEKDKTELIEMAGKIQDRLDEDFTGPLVLEGSHGTYKEFGGSPLKPYGNESCSDCGLCARKGPVAAIDSQNPKATDPEKCISCMRCISICPKGARGVDPELLATISERISPLLGGRKDNHLFL